MTPLDAHPSSTSLRLILWYLPAFFLTWIFYVKAAHPELHHVLSFEDAPFEWIQFWCYIFAASLAVASTIRHLRHNERTLAWILGLFALGMLFVAMEEINWGQWILSLELPPYFEQRNTQKNLTVHNLDIIQPYLHAMYIVVGLGGALVALFRNNLCRTRVGKRFFKVLPDRYQSLYFLPVALFYLFTDWLSPFLVSIGFSLARVSFDYEQSYLIFSDQESFEVLLAFGFLLFAWSTFVRAAAAK